jgi:quinol monooxygenase YgiN
LAQSQFDAELSDGYVCVDTLWLTGDLESLDMAHPTYGPNELNQGFVVAIQLEANPGEEERLATSLQELIVPTMAEPGVKLFLPYRSPTDPKLFFVYELYVNEAGWAAHQQTSHFKAFVDEMLPRLARRERVPFVPFARI